MLTGDKIGKGEIEPYRISKIWDWFKKGTSSKFFNFEMFLFSTRFEDVRYSLMKDYPEGEV
jgi:hypothetical protein